jgi:23S rRNA (uracil1939-C5)-methyltransferase
LLTLPSLPRPGDLLDIEIDTLNPDGEGCCTILALHNGEPRHFTLTLRHSLPGERLRVEVRDRKRGQVFVKRVAQISPSPSYTTPRCPHFGLPDNDARGCGGCALQHLPYADQLEWKSSLIHNFFERSGVPTDPIQPIIGFDPPWFYRNKMEFSFGFDPQKRFALGMHPEGHRHDILRLSSCALFAPWLEPLLPLWRDWLDARGVPPYLPTRNQGFLRSLTVREGKRTNQRMVELLTTADPSPTCIDTPADAHTLAHDFLTFALQTAAVAGFPLTSAYWTQQVTAKGTRTHLVEHLIHGQPFIEEVLDVPSTPKPLRFEIHPRAFFQTNPRQAERLYGLVVEALLSSATPNPRVLDLYCGTGTIGLCLAPAAHRVVGVELSPQAVDSARRNATLNDLPNATFFAGDVAQVITTPAFQEAIGGAVDWLIVDPPRAGLSPQALQHVLHLRAPHLVYVSCNPDTLSRDLANLCAPRGPYSLTNLQPIDMFPHTRHVEAVATLSLS